MLISPEETVELQEKERVPGIRRRWKMKEKSEERKEREANSDRDFKRYIGKEKRSWREG